MSIPTHRQLIAVAIRSPEEALPFPLETIKQSLLDGVTVEALMSTLNQKGSAHGVKVKATRGCYRFLDSGWR
ncbi:hypothetical protein ABC733_25205 [Mangrovibacter sp. SLW1]